LGLLIGVVAAAIVGLLVIAGVPLTLAGAVIAAGVLAIIFGFGVELAGFPEWLKTPIYNLAGE
jgi:hypothetical protein